MVGRWHTRAFPTHFPGLWTHQQSCTVIRIVSVLSIRAGKPFLSFFLIKDSWLTGKKNQFGASHKFRSWFSRVVLLEEEREMCKNLIYLISKRWKKEKEKSRRKMKRCGQRQAATRRQRRKEKKNRKHREKGLFGSKLVLPQVNMWARPLALDCRSNGL